MNKPKLQTVYLPIERIHDTGYFFTAEQLNEYTANVIKQALETAAENAEGYTEGAEGNDAFVDRQSITNTFEEIFEKFKI